jgi:mediator of replication checkpoint protein 1
MLRRKRGGDMLDLDDSDDDLAERRRRKQEEFARMRNALLADEKVGKIGRLPSSLGSKADWRSAKPEAAGLLPGH